MNQLQKGLIGGAMGGGKKKTKARGQRTELTEEQKADIKEAFDLFDDKQQ
jgi:Ca2+-binding EF-hand superfamily protein